VRHRAPLGGSGHDHPWSVSFAATPSVNFVLSLLEDFFTLALIQQAHAIPIPSVFLSAYLRLSLSSCRRGCNNPPITFELREIDAPLIVAFRRGFEKHGLCVRTVILRLTALHPSFLRRVRSPPAHSAQIQRVLAIPAIVHSGPGPVSSRLRKRCSARQLRINALLGPAAIKPLCLLCWRPASEYRG